MKRIVFDASALMTLFDDGPGVEKVKEWIELADAKEIEAEHEHSELGRSLLLHLARI